MSEKDKKSKVIVVHESLAQSVIKDIFSISLLSAGMWLEVWIGSGWLQLFIGIIWVFMLLGLGLKYLRDGAGFGFDAARKRIDELEVRYK